MRFWRWFGRRKAPRPARVPGSPYRARANELPGAPPRPPPSAPTREPIAPDYVPRPVQRASSKLTLLAVFGFVSLARVIATPASQTRSTPFPPPPPWAADKAPNGITAWQEGAHPVGDPFIPQSPLQDWTHTPSHDALGWNGTPTRAFVGHDVMPRAEPAPSVSSDHASSPKPSMSSPLR